MGGVTVALLTEQSCSVSEATASLAITKLERRCASRAKTAEKRSESSRDGERYLKKVSAFLPEKNVRKAHTLEEVTIILEYKVNFNAGGFAIYSFVGNFCALLVK
ncbi:hypothetical protein CKO50_01515 [Pseudoalteromonas sp. HM-SA03]|uniref:hypothetical protein n=1 Tax=Pseudoalteromonas sp. HM-SA03 TaxID=2029678 RepID=UPI000BAE0859|nr:hypothetical protein [Pseudoalteromonas sp. HM-SA03]PAY03019.1 hypothetical protein CKO50_01515 [Pseudoalteromonas sp. HM-SA03]